MATLTATTHVVLPATGGALLLSGGEATLATTAGTSLTATGGALLLSGAEAGLLTTGPIVLDATGGTLAALGPAPRCSRSAPVWRRPSRARGQVRRCAIAAAGVIELIDEHDWVEVAVILTEIINAGR